LASMNTDGGGKGSEATSPSLRQAQVHSWLHHIKNQVENEPNVFEDFEIVKDREIKNSIPFDSLKAELTDDVEALFRPYFEAVLLSPASQWLLKSMEKMEFARGTNGKSTTPVTMDSLVQDYAFGECMDDIESYPSTETYESSYDIDAVRSSNTSLAQETYSKLWKQFVDTLWNSTDSLWLMPCSSEEKPRPLATDVSGHSHSTANEKWLSPASQDRQKIVSDVMESLILNRLDNITVSENRRKTDHDQWLLKSDHHPPQSWHQQGDAFKSPPKSMEEWLGWNALLEKLRGMGQECWLYRPPLDPAAGEAKTETSYMEF